MSWAYIAKQQSNVTLNNRIPFPTPPSNSSNNRPSRLQGYVQSKSTSPQQATSKGAVHPLVHSPSPSNVPCSPLAINLQEEASEDEGNVSSGDEPQENIGTFLSEKGSSEHDSIFSVFKSKTSKFYFIVNFFMFFSKKKICSKRRIYFQSGIGRRTATVQLF